MIRSRLAPAAVLRRAALPLLVAAALGQAALGQIDLEVVVNPDPAVPGETLDLEFTITNSGGSALLDLTLEFDWPLELASQFDSTFDGDCPSTTCDPTEIATFAIPVLPAGKGLTFSVPARIHAATATGTFVDFDARVYDDGLLEATDSATVVVDAAPDVRFVLVEDRDPVAPGQDLRYTLTYGALETGGGSPSGSLQMPVPAGTTFVSATGGGQVQSGIVEWPLAQLSPGESREEHVVFQLAPGSTLGTILRAEAFYQDQAPIPNVAGQRSATRIQTAPALSITLNAGPDAARTDETLDVELTVGNTGTLARSGVWLSFEYPDQLASIFDVAFDGDCPSTTCDPGERVLFNVGTLGAGESVSYSLPPRVLASITNGSVARLEAEVFDSTGEISESATSFAVLKTRDLNLALVEDHDPVAPGGTITYTLTYALLQTGVGVSSAQLELPLPLGTSFVAASGAGALVGDTVEWSLGALNPGAGGEVTVTLAVAPGAAPGSALLAEASFLSTGSPPRIVRHQATTRVQAPDDLVFEISAGPDGARRGETLDLELTVTNSGSLARSGILLTLEYPDQLASVFDVSFDGDCPSTTCDPGEFVTFNVGNLAAGEGKTYSMPVLVDSSIVQGEVLRLEAELTGSSGFQSETGTSLVVEESQVLELAVIEDRDPVAPGERITYTLTYGTLITGPGCPDATLDLPLPEGTSFVSATDGGSPVGGSIRWPLGPLNPGASGQVRATVLVAEDAPLGTLLATEALFLGGAFDSELRYENTSRVESALPLELGIAVGPHSGRPGEMLDIEVTVGNTGALARSGVVLTLEYPDLLSSIFEVGFDGDCPSTTCDPRELVTFDVGLLPAGESVTYSFSPRIAPFALDGSVMRFEAEVVDSSERRREAGTGLTIAANRDLELAVMDTKDAVQPGEFMTYRVTYGALATGSGSSNALLRFDIPEGLLPVTASDDGKFVGQSVQWPLGSLAPGAGGERVVLLVAEEQLLPGSVLTAEAQLVGGGAGDLHASATTRVEDDPPIELDVKVKPTTPLPGSTLEVRVKVTNNTALDRTGLTVWLEYPDELNSLFDNQFVGDCPSTTCDPQERVFFDIPVLGAGQTVFLTMPPVISNTAVHGSVIRFDGIVIDNAGRMSAAGKAIVVGDDFDAPERGDDWHLLFER